MQFNFALLLAAVASVSVSATPVKRQSTSTTCSLLLTPQSTVPTGTNLVSEFNYALGRTLSIDAGNVVINHSGSTFTPSGASYVVVNTLSADGKTAAETGAIIEAWVSTVLQGFTIDWFVNSASCV